MRLRTFRFARRPSRSEHLLDLSARARTLTEMAIGAAACVVVAAQSAALIRPDAAPEPEAAAFTVASLADAAPAPMAPAVLVAPGAASAAPGAPGAIETPASAEIAPAPAPEPLETIARGPVNLVETAEPAPAGPRADDLPPRPAPAIIAPPSPADAAREAVLRDTLAHRVTETHRVRSGSTLANLLDSAGVDRADRHAAVLALNDVFDLRGLRAGTDVTLYLDRAAHDESGEDANLIGLAFAPEEARLVHVARLADAGYRARDIRTPLTRRLARAQGEITQSLYVDATNAGANGQVVADIANILAYSVDFQREIQPGDAFDILFEEWVDPSGAAVRTGELYYVRFTPRGRNLEYWRFVNADDEVEFFDASGESAQRFLMRTPINGARLSSHYGRRRHPISGYSRMHRGTDFAAPTGTPVYAAGNGVVERANRYGGYGNYIRVRHANGYKTAYAHLNGFARGVRAGARVRQGQIIGYVGSTGASTGPHLHYEVLRNGDHVNPMTLDLPTGRTLEDAERAGFDVERARISALLERMNAPAALHAVDAGEALETAPAADDADDAAPAPAPAEDAPRRVEFAERAE